MSMGIHWRDLTTFDLPVVDRLAAAIHPGFPEHIAILAERQRLYPDGARLLELEGEPAGYLLSHPWRRGDIPALNTPLHRLPEDANNYYLHDLALLPAARGTGAAADVVEGLVRHAAQRGFATMSLVAVNGSAPFWTRHGFAAVVAPGLGEKLASYDASASFMVARL